jgi:hypothetical protein
MSRYAILNQIRQLDPARDHQQIVLLVGTYESPFLIQRALEFALFRTFALPRTAKLLVETGNSSSAVSSATTTQRSSFQNLSKTATTVNADALQSGA